jgi:hypothetical protein
MMAETMGTQAEIEAKLSIDLDWDTDPDAFKVQEGDAGDNSLYGTETRDRLLGGAGDDLLFASDGRDYLEAGDGRDLLYGNRGRDDWVEDRFAFDRDDSTDFIFHFAPQFEPPGDIPLPDGSWGLPPRENDKIVLLGGTRNDIDALIGQAEEQAEERATIIPWANSVTLVYGETYIFLDVNPLRVTTDMFMLG